MVGGCGRFGDGAVTSQQERLNFFCAFHDQARSGQVLVSRVTGQVNSILPLDLLGLQSRQQLAVCRLMRKLVEERLDSGHRNF